MAKGNDKAGIKLKIRKLKGDRDSAIETKDPEKLKEIRREIKSFKNKLRKAVV